MEILIAIKPRKLLNLIFAEENLVLTLNISITYVDNKKIILIQ